MFSSTIWRRFFRIRNFQDSFDGFCFLTMRKSLTACLIEYVETGLLYRRRYFLTDDDFFTGFAMEVARNLVGGRVVSLSRVGGGRNSRLYRVDAGNDVYALKQYPSLEDDPRDRLGIEAGALKWMALHGLDMVPRLVATDRNSNSSLLSWAEG